MLPPLMPKKGNTMNDLMNTLARVQRESAPSPLVLKGKQRKAKITAKVDDGKPAWVSRTPIGKQDESPMFRHVSLNSDKDDIVEDTYLGTRLITSGKGSARYADLYVDGFDLRVVARWSNKVDDVTIGFAEDTKVPGIDAALKIAKRRKVAVASRG